jgi:hypothetical protein
MFCSHPEVMIVTDDRGTKIDGHFVFIRRSMIVCIQPSIACIEREKKDELVISLYISSSNHRIFTYIC